MWWFACVGAFLIGLVIGGLGVTLSFVARLERDS